MTPPDEIASVSDALRPASRWENTLGMRGDARFATTRWSVVLSLQTGSEAEAAEALALLCQTYWYPLYAYVRRSGKSPEEAQDLTQEFFARLLEKETLTRARKDKGKLRTFLLTVMKRFLINEWKRSSAEKRGGGRQHLPLNFDDGEERYRDELTDQMTPDQVYERQWAVNLLARVMDGLRDDYVRRGAEARFDTLKDALWWNANEASYAGLGTEIGMSENAVKQAVSRLRKQYRQRLKKEIADTLDSDEEEAVAAELNHLIGLLRKP